jgi:hypothetical protein
MSPEEQLVHELQLLSHNVAEQYITREVFEKEKAALIAKFSAPAAAAATPPPAAAAQPRLSVESEHEQAIDIGTDMAMAALTTMFPTLGEDDVEAALKVLDPHTAETFLRKKHGLETVEGNLADFVARIEARKRAREVDTKATPRSILQGTKDFRDHQKLKLEKARERLEQGYSVRARMSSEVGLLSKGVLQKLEACTSEREEPPPPVQLEELVSLAAAEGDAGEQMVEWLLGRLAHPADASKTKVLQLMAALLGTAKAEVESVLEESRCMVEELVSEEGSESIYSDADNAWSVNAPAQKVIGLLNEARERILDGRRRRRAEVAELTARLKIQAEAEAEAAVLEPAVLLLLLQATTDNGKQVAQLEAVMGLTSALQNAAVHVQIKQDMFQYRAENPEHELWQWAKTSIWSADTGGDLDEQGAPMRAQTGVWLEMWTSVLAAQAGGTLEQPGEEDVPLLAAPRRIMQWLCELLGKARADGSEMSPTVVLKILDVLKALCMDVDFLDSLRAEHMQQLGRLRQFSCALENAPLQAMVRREARDIYEELNPEARAAREEREAVAAAAVEAAGTFPACCPRLFHVMRLPDGVRCCLYLLSWGATEGETPCRTTQRCPQRVI